MKISRVKAYVDGYGIPKQDYCWEIRFAPPISV